MYCITVSHFESHCSLIYDTKKKEVNVVILTRGVISFHAAGATAASIGATAKASVEGCKVL